MKKIALTGYSGFVGSKIAKGLVDGGYSLLELGRKKSHRNHYYYELGQDIHEEVFSDVEVLIHAAYDFNCKTEQDVIDKNEKGSVNLFKKAKASGVRHLIFISSVSSFSTCKSLYGKVKYHVEQEVLKMGGTVLRPGLVYGREMAGMFGALENIVQKFRVIPLVGRGEQKFYMCHYDDLAAMICKLIKWKKQDLNEIIFAAHDQPVTFKVILDEMGRLHGKKLIFLPLPVFLVYSGLKTLEGIGLKFRFSSDNLLGMIHENPEVNFEHEIFDEQTFRAFDLESVN